MTVKDNVIAVGKDTLDLAASIRMIRRDSSNEQITQQVGLRLIVD
jgi:hypothetical protein